MCVILWYVDDNWKIEQHLLRFLLIAHSMTGEGVARELFTLSTELGITTQYLLATMQGRASVNNVAVRTLQVMYPDALDVGCFHTHSTIQENVLTLQSWMSFCDPGLVSLFTVPRKKSGGKS